jgi:hypothetical protein
LWRPEDRIDRDPFAIVLDNQCGTGWPAMLNAHLNVQRSSVLDTVLSGIRDKLLYDECKG